MTKREVTKEINAAIKDAKDVIDKALTEAEEKINEVCIKSGFSYYDGTPKHAAKNIINDFVEEFTWHPFDLFNEKRQRAQLAAYKKALAEGDTAKAKRILGVKA